MNRKRQLIPLLLSFVCPASSTPQKRLLSDKSSPPQPVSANTSTVTPSPQLLNPILKACSSWIKSAAPFHPVSRHR
ncbi:hypothetical protein B0H13DRAFT_1969936, partial [Mycena leptocephala]